MKHGSGLVGSHRGRFFNEQPNVHRFLRFDGQRFPNRYWFGDGRKLTTKFVESRYAVIGQWGDFAAGAGATLEVIGQIWCAADRAYIRGSGTIILSEGAALSDGGRASFYIGPDSTVAFLEDSQLGTESSMQTLGCASISCAGTLMFGLPDRPIRKDTVFAVSGMTREQVNRTLGGGSRAPGASLILTPQSRIAIHSVDPKKARVIIKMHDSKIAQARSERFGKPDGIVCYFAGKSELNGVLFDNIIEGGIMAPPAARATWKNVFFGEHNLAEPDKLYYDLKP
jgi:hypothetical protein